MARKFPSGKQRGYFLADVEVMVVLIPSVVIALLGVWCVSESRGNSGIYKVQIRLSNETNRDDMCNPI